MEAVFAATGVDDDAAAEGLVNFDACAAGEGVVEEDDGLLLLLEEKLTGARAGGGGDDAEEAMASCFDAFASAVAPPGVTLSDFARSTTSCVICEACAQPMGR